MEEWEILNSWYFAHHILGKEEVLGVRLGSLKVNVSTQKMIPNTSDVRVYKMSKEESSFRPMSSLRKRHQGIETRQLQC